MRRLKLLIAACALSGTAAAVPAQAGPFGDELGRCLVTSSTDTERGAMIRWMFVAFAGHPQVTDLVPIPRQRQQETSRAVATVYNRLMLNACRQQMIQAIRVEGPASVHLAFQVLGQAAAGELMNSPAGAAVIAGLQDYIDMAGIEALLREAGVPVGPAAQPPRR